MRRRQLIGLLALTGLAGLAPRPARAEPYLMVRSGAKCNACHTNQTGGGKRTAFAHIHSRDILHDLDVLPIPKGVKPFTGEINSWVSVGGDLRVRNTTVFGDRPNSQGRVPENKAFRRHVDSNETDLIEALGYFQVDLWPEILTAYLDEDFSGGATTREAFALIRGFAPWDTYVKVGRMFPTYGTRVQDDQAYIRSRTGYTFETSDEGAEIGVAPGPFFLATSLTNGPSDDKDVAATINGYGLFDQVPFVRSVLAGASFARQSNERSVSAFYTGTNLWTLTALAEFDLIDDRTDTIAHRDQYASYLELDWLLFDWLNLRGTFEFIKVAGDRDQTRYTVGTEPFLSRFLQPRIQYRINNGPGNRPVQNQDELWVELHVFL